MCGIAGILGRGWGRETLQAMIAAQRHRGPDDEGAFVDDAGGAGLGHARLSILDLSAAGHQPMADRTGTRHVVLNGEIYNYRELRAELADYPYRSQTDTEVLLAAYERWGDACVERCNGMFAFALWDAPRRRLFCARDRLGIKPFYYAQDGERLCFASEVKALLAAGVEPRMDEAVVRDYLLRGWYEHSPATFFAGVRALPPGHTLVVEDGAAVERPYWDLAALVGAMDEPAAPPPRWEEEMAALLDDAVRLRLRSDVPVGMHLSGGLDSSVLVSVLDRLLPPGAVFEALTSTFGDPRYDEAIHARRLTRQLELRLTEARCTADDFWETAERLQIHQEQPFGGVSTLGYWSLEAAARDRGVTVVLEGQGGDELFGGYAYYLADHVQDLLDAGQDGAAAAVVDRTAARNGVPAAAMRARVERMRRSRGAIFQDGSAFLRPDCLTPEFVAGDAAAGGASFPLPATSAFRRARVRDLRYTKLPRVLRFNDRTSMAFGRELRVPLLDHRLVELSFRLPDALLLWDGHAKWPLRRVVAGRLDDAVRLAPKRPVVTPQKEWLRGPLRAEARRRLERSELARRGILDRERALAAFDRFCQDQRIENAFYVWQWLNLDLWLAAFQLR